MAGKPYKAKQINEESAAQTVATINNEIRLQLSINAAASKSSSRPESIKPAAAASKSKLEPESVSTNSKASTNLWNGGSWRAKASPVSAIAIESISVSGGATSEYLNTSPTKGSAPSVNNGLKTPSKSVPIVPEPTKVNARGANDNNANLERRLRQDLESPATALGGDQSVVADEKAAQSQSSWLGWWSRPDGYANSNPDPQLASKKPPTPVPISSQPIVPTPEATESAERSPPAQQRLSVDIEKPPRETPSRSWFRLWSATQNQHADPQAHREQVAPAVAATIDPTSAGTDERPKTPRRPDNDGQSRPRSATSPPARLATGWAFWSSDKGGPGRVPTDGTQKHLGELAVADTPSQSHPEAAQFNQQAHPRSKQSDTITSKIAVPSSTTPILTLALDATAPPPSAGGKNKPKSEAARLAAATQALQSKLRGPPNHVLPSFTSTYPPAHAPSYFERIGQYLASSLRLSSDAPTSAHHVCVSPSVPKIKTAIAIGVHGYFPAAIIQKVLGQPTGTSIRFANYAADSIRWWSEQHQPDTTCEIEQIALEGEGLIADRVDTLWKLLLNWLSHLRNADLILVACHSQGVPVSVMLVAKLIELGCLGTHVKIGICAMAGVNLGPFIDFKSKFFGGSAAELFEFANPESVVSREYASSLDITLRHGVRVTYIGSLDDQLVSLESSLFINLSHPYVQRAVFIDGRLHSPDFVSHLVAFALKLRNLGISDHGLIRELSSPLAGSLYGGEGHSRLYDDEQVYRLALMFTLNTTDMDSKTYVSASGAATGGAQERRRSNGGIPSSTVVANNIRRGNTSASQRPDIAPVVAAYQSVSAANANPYFLPWALRGILEEQTVKTGMQDELRSLIESFDDWRPVTKMLKDVRFRLEAVKSAATVG